MIKTAIIDDEQSCREILETLIGEHFPELQITGMADSIATGKQCIDQHRPDLVFLDINLKDGTGFDLLQNFDTVDFKIIFVTAYDEFAVKAIRYNAIDYILKPINIKEFKTGVQKAISDLSTRETAAPENHRVTPKEKKIVLKTADSIYLVKLHTIFRCTSESSYTTFFLKNNDKIVVSKTMREFEEVLENNGFMRIHQSHIINLNYVERFDKRDGGSVILSDKTRIPVSHRRKQKLLKYFEEL